MDLGNFLPSLKNFFHMAVLGTIPHEICQNHIAEVWNNILKFKLWAIRMVDSTAKIPTGLMTGSLVNFGNMDECIEVKVDEEFGSFSGKHCMVQFQIPLNSSSSLLRSIKYEWGVCIPSTCTATDLKYFLRYTLQLPAETNEMLCHTLDEESPYQTKELVTIGILAFLALLVIISTIYDYATSSGEKNKYILSFSIKTNMRNLLNTRTPPDSVDVMHGIRFFAMMFVVLEHVYFNAAVIGTDINRILYVDWLSNWRHVWLTSRGFAVDIFLVFGGLLVSYSFMKDRAKGKRFNLAVYYIHRYIRMTPTLALVLLFNATLFNRLGSGPWWKSYSAGAEETCQVDWWKHILYINNWWGIEKCMEHTWYLCVDMQLYILSPILLIPLHRWPRIGLGMSSAVLVAAFFTSFGISYASEEKVDIFRNAGDPTERLLYRVTYNRITPWLMGFILGYFLHTYRQLKSSSDRQVSGKRRIDWLTVLATLVTWIISGALFFGVLFAVHPFIQLDYQYSAFESSLYLAATHVTIALCIVFLVVACVTGYGGPVTVFFSWEFFVPLSRLSYCTYLIHLMIVQLRFIDVRTKTFLSDFNLVMSMISILLLSIFFSLIPYLMMEQPAGIIERLLLHADSAQESKSEPQPSTSHPTLTHDGGHTNAAFELPERRFKKRV